MGGHQFLPLELSIGLGLYRWEAVLLLPDVDQWMQELDVAKHAIGFAKLEVNGGIYINESLILWCDPNLTCILFEWKRRSIITSI